MVKFSIPRVNLIDSDAGFSVEILGRVGLRYREGNKIIFVDSEILMGSSGFGVFSERIKPEELSPSQDPIDLKDKERIVDNIRLALKFMGYDIVIV